LIAASLLCLAVAAAQDAALLADAAERGGEQELRTLIESGTPVNAPQVDGMTALAWAAFRDDLASARLLIDAGADASLGNRYGIPPLALACQNGNSEMVRLLLAAGAEPAIKLGGGETLLMTAARTGRVESVKALIDAGLDVNAKERQQQTAMMWAAAEGHTEVVELLLQSGADFRTPLKSGLTPLLFAVRGGHTEAVLALIKAGADLNEATQPEHRNPRLARPGTAALMLAVENGHFELALQLIDLGADPNDQRSDFTPLHAVTWVRKTARGEDDDGTPPPDGSGNIRSLDFIRQLVQRGADVNARLEKGGGGGGRMHMKGATPFLLAAKAADLPMLRLLVELGADPTLTNVENCTPLLAAAGIGVLAPGEEPGSEDEAIETITYLMELGADLNAVDDNGETVMHAAAYKCMAGLLQWLDANGADIHVWNRKNRYGWTPLLIAQGHRPGNFRPIQETIDALSEIMLKQGITPPPAPPRPGG